MWIFEYADLSETMSVGARAFLVAIAAGVLTVLLMQRLRRRIEADVAERVAAEHIALAREINHRLGNYLQIAQSAIRLERRSAISNDARLVLNRLDEVMTLLAVSYHAEEPRYSGRDAKTGDAA